MSESVKPVSDDLNPLDHYRRVSDQLDTMLTGVALKFQENMKRAAVASLEEFSAHADQIVSGVGEKMNRARGPEDGGTFTVRVPGENGRPDTEVTIPTPQVPTAVDDVLAELRLISEKLDTLIILGQQA